MDYPERTEVQISAKIIGIHFMDSNRAPPEYKSVALPLHPSVRSES
jgi:hypothetical protein